MADFFTMFLESCGRRGMADSPGIAARKPLTGCRSRSKTRTSRAGRRFESLETKNLLAAVPFGAQPNDTAIYMVGDVNVNVVFLESDGSHDPSTENWTTTHKDAVKQKIIDGLQWWEEVYDATGYTADLNFHFDFTHADNPVATKYEPINRISNDYSLWVDEFLTKTGNQTGASLADDIRRFNHNGRLEHETNWSFTIFVVNSENDLASGSGGTFVSGGSHSQAFAFAGGLFFVMPSTRPASTVAHEAGHMFYAYDEYSGGGNYFAHRGYLNAQNTNALSGNPNPALRQTSIMDAHQVAFSLHAVSDSAREMIGWRDSDNDGIVDILDVAHTLTGTGRYDSAAGSYHFEGYSAVNTLANLNPWDLSLQSDVTLNSLSRLEYRIDGGAWLTGATLSGYSADINVDLPDVPSTATQIEIRTIDDYTGTTSTVFAGTLAQPSATGLPGVNGFVWLDSNANGVWDSNESAVSNWTIHVLDSQSAPIAPPVVIEADNFADNEVLNHANVHATLSAIGFGVWENTVRARARDGGAPGEQVFKHFIGTGWSSSWTFGNNIAQFQRQLRIDFSSPVTTVSIDAIANSNKDFGKLEIYDSADNLLGRYTTQELANNQIETMTLGVDSPRIAYAIASGHANTGVDLDNLQFNAASSATTAAAGNYSASYLQPGAYKLNAQAQPGYVFTTQATQDVVVGVGATVSSVNFGVVASGPVWQNQDNRLDVDRSGGISLNDALLVVAELRRRGPHALEGEPSGSNAILVDVNGDGSLSIGDALDIVVYLRQNPPSGGEGELSLAAAAETASDSLVAEGEGEVATFKLQVTNLAGTPISTIEVGQQFLVKVFAQDLRPASFPERGIQVAFLDILYDAGPVAPVPTSGAFPIDITFSPDFQHTPDLIGATPGLINDVGALQTNPGGALPLGAGEVLIFTIKFNAVAGGEVLFQGDDADEPGNDVRFFEPPDPAIDPTLVSYGTAALTVVQPLKANPDSFNVAVGSSSNLLNVRQNDTSTGSFTVSSVGSTASGGTVSIPAGGTQVSYTPPAGFTGFDAFNYTIRSGTATSTARVQVKIGNPIPPYRNPNNPLDVDTLNGVTLNDALLVVADLRINGVHAVVLPTTPASAPPPFLDVNGDNAISISDALGIIAFLRNQQSGGEGEATAASSLEQKQPAASDQVDRALVDWIGEDLLSDESAVKSLLACMAGGPAAE